MQELTRQLIEGGEAAIQGLIGRAESYGLEFKEKADPKTPGLSKGDKKNISAALSAFSNTNGGVVVFGVGTDNRSRPETASKLVSIADIERVRDDVAGRLGELLSPDNPSIEVHAVPTAADATAGYLVIDIPFSEDRPHMSVATNEKRYYRRTETGNEAMGHYEIRDQMLAVRQAVLAPVWQLGSWSTALPGGVGEIRFQVRVSLRNNGRITARLPYLWVHTDPKVVHRGVSDGPIPRTRHDGSTGFNGGGSLVIHPDDQVAFAEFSLKFIFDAQIFRSRAFDPDLENLLDDDIWRLHADGLTLPELDTFGLRIVAGAENCAARETSWTIGKAELVRGVAHNALEMFNAPALAHEAARENLNPSDAVVLFGRT